MTPDLAHSLRDRTSRVTVWGGGFVGFSTAACYAREGVLVEVRDTSARVVETIRAGESPVAELRDWLAFDPKPLIDGGLLSAAAFDEPMDGYRPVHFLAVPTERDGEPWLDALWAVIDRIIGLSRGWGDAHVLLIVESTLVPGTSLAILKRILGSNLRLAVAPRRDWFAGEAHSLRTLPRVYAGDDVLRAIIAEQVLGIVCDNLVRADSLREAELVKALENAYRHVEITLAHQVARAFPGVDADHLFELAATKWNFGDAWKVGLGIGGYCLPLAPRYLLAGADRPGELSILRAAIDYADELPAHAAAALVDFDRVAVLGLTYRADLSVTQQSPGVALARHLVAAGKRVFLHDDLLGPDRCLALVPGAQAYPGAFAAMAASDAVVVAAGHRAYATLPPSMARCALKRVQLVIDTARIWTSVHIPEGCLLRHPGEPGWQEPPKLATLEGADHEPLEATR